VVKTMPAIANMAAVRRTEKVIMARKRKHKPGTALASGRRATFVAKEVEGEVVLEPAMHDHVWWQGVRKKKKRIPFLTARVVSQNKIPSKTLHDEKERGAPSLPTWFPRGNRPLFEAKTPWRP